MKLTKGEKAIEFVTDDISGNVIDLKSYRGKKILLTFYRGASCPFCNLRMHEVIKRANDFREKGLQIIAFFMSEREEILKYAGKQNPPFPIIPDPNKIYYSKYGLEKSLVGKIKAMFRINVVFRIFTNGFFSLKALKDDNTLPGDFLINEEGIIEHAYYGKDFSDHISFNEITNWVEN